LQRHRERKAVTDGAVLDERDEGKTVASGAVLDQPRGSVHEEENYNGARETRGKRKREDLPSQRGGASSEKKISVMRGDAKS